MILDIGCRMLDSGCRILDFNMAGVEFFIQYPSEET